MYIYIIIKDYVYIPPKTGVPPKVYHVTNSLGFI